MPARPFAIALVVATTAAIAVYWLTDWPLGVPGEWTWDRIPVPAGLRAEALLGIVGGLIVAAAFLLLAAVGDAWIERLGRLGRAGCLLGLVVAGFGWLHVLQESPSDGYGLSKAPWVLYYPGSSGYYFHARHAIHTVDGFLAAYDEIVNDPEPSRRTLHLGTHPPGLFLCHYTLQQTCRASPGLRRLLIATQPESIDLALDTISVNTYVIGELDRAALWLAALLTQLVAVAALLPLYLLLRVDHSPRAAWRAVAFWPLVPALAVFLPKSDCLFPLIATGVTWLWWSGLRHGGWWRPLLAGGLLWLGLFLSLAFLPVAVLAAILAVWMCRRGELDPRRGLVLAGIAAGGLVLPTLACWWAFDLFLPAVWAANLQNHAEFYAQQGNPRSYLSWLLVNPIELVLATGVPLVLLAGVGLARRIKDKNVTSAAPAWAALLTWAALWLSGKNMGEAARLWLFLMPWACWLAASWFHDSRGRYWLFPLALQALFAIATVTRVTGFHFAQFAGGP